MKLAAIPYTYTNHVAYGVLIRYWKGCFESDIEEIIFELSACPGADHLLIDLFAAGVKEMRSPETVLQMLSTLPHSVDEFPSELREHLLLGDLDRQPADLARAARAAEAALTRVMAARQRDALRGASEQPVG